MVEAGVVREGSRAFLWDGEVVEPMAEDQPHINALYRLLMILAAQLTEADWTININQPIQLEPGYRPEPDLAVFRGPRDLYTDRGRRPAPGDLVLLIEVADSSYPADSGELLRKYAQAGIPQYWIINIRGRAIEVYTEADAGTQSYRRRTVYAPDGRIPLTFTTGTGTVNLGQVEVRDVLRNSID